VASVVLGYTGYNSEVPLPDADTLGNSTPGNATPIICRLFGFVSSGQSKLRRNRSDGIFRTAIFLRKMKIYKTQKLKKIIV
jgi:hypothetical protein